MTTTDNSGVRIFPPGVYLAALGVGVLAHIWLPTYQLALAARWILGGALLASWAALAIWSFASLRRAGTSINPTRPTTALVIDGPFKLTRNPLYVSLTLGYLGIVVLASLWWALLLLPLVLMFVQRAIIEREESYLQRKFGQEYLTYKAHVRRWV